MDPRQLHLLGATGKARVETFDGQEHLVVPVVALVEGVIHAVNASMPEYVPGRTLSQMPHAWNGRPLVVGHPTHNGHQISANDPRVLERQGFGFIAQSQVRDNRLGLEAWANVKKLESLGQHDLLKSLREGIPVEVSVGAFVTTSPKQGTFNGKQYKAEWTTIAPDHLAFLPGGRGACSIEMGCGSGRFAEAYLVTAEGLETLSNPEGINQYSNGGSPKLAKHEADILSKVTADGWSPNNLHEEAIANRLVKQGKLEKGEMHGDAVYWPVEHKALGGVGSGWFAEAGHVTTAAKSATEAAMKASSRASVGFGEGASRSAHAEARDAHQIAAAFNREAGRTEQAAHHDTMARYHGDVVKRNTLPATSRAARTLEMKTSQVKTKVAEFLKTLRDIPKSERDQMDTSDFAGPNESYPIKKPEDVAAAAALVGKAENPTSVKKRIIAIANRKGAEFVAQLPKSWRGAEAGDDAEEAAELIAYRTIDELLDQIGSSYDAAKATIQELIADETETPTETVVEEDAETTVEEAKLRAIQALALSMASGLGSIVDLCARQLYSNLPAPSDSRYMEALRTAIGARNSAADAATIQAAHDKSHDIHDHTVALGASCSKGSMKNAAKKMMDCPTCDGSGNVGGNPCDACDGSGEVPFKAAEGIRAACRCEEADVTKTEHIAALLRNDHNPIKNQKALEAMSDSELTALQAKCEEFQKTAADLKAAQEQATALRAAANTQLTEEEFLKRAPETIRTLVADKKAQDAVRKDTLVGQLKTAAAGVYTEDELKALSLPELERMAKLTKTEVNVDYSGRGIAAPRAAAENDVFANPPNPYAEALKRRAAAAK